MPRMPDQMDRATAALAQIGAQRGAQQAAISQQKPITPPPQQPQMPPPQQAMPPQQPPGQPPMGAGMKRGGKVKPMVKKMASGGMASSASKRGDGCATKGKTKGRFV